MDDSLTSNKPGCGIGTGIAKKLVEDMEGQITCEANKPKGPGSESYFHNQVKMKRKYSLRRMTPISGPVCWTPWRRMGMKRRDFRMEVPPSPPFGRTNGIFFCSIS